MSIMNRVFVFSCLYSNLVIRKFQFAETVGFEPTRAIKPYFVSSEALSTTQPRLHYMFLDIVYFYNHILLYSMRLARLMITRTQYHKINIVNGSYSRLSNDASLNPTNTPITPPTALNITALIDSTLLPQKFGANPPRLEPINNPPQINDFLLMPVL